MKKLILYSTVFLLVSFTSLEKHNAIQKHLDIYSFSINSSRDIEEKDLPTRISDNANLLTNFGLGLTIDYRNKKYDSGFSPIMNISIFQSIHNMGNVIIGGGTKWRDVYHNIWIDLNFGAGFLIGPYTTHTYFIDENHNILQTESENKNAFSLIPLLSISVGHPFLGKNISLGITSVTFDITTFIISVSI